MVLNYAKQAVDSVKEGYKKVKDNVIGEDTSQSPEEFGFNDIGEGARSIQSHEEEIHGEISRIGDKFSSERERANKKLNELEERPVSLDEIGIDKDHINFEGRDDRFMTNLFADSISTLEINSDSLGDYVEELTGNIRALTDEIALNERESESLGDTTIKEMLEDNYDTEIPEDSYAASVMNSTKVGGLLNEKKREKQNQLSTLKNELIDTVDQYTQELYDEAVSLAEDLGGEGRDYEGEFDILQELSNSRSELLCQANSSELLSRSGLLEDSHETLESQSKVVDRYIEHLENYKSNIVELYSQASNVLDQENLASVEGRVRAIDEGLDKLPDVMTGEEYDDIDSALEETVERGLGREEVPAGVQR